MMNYSRLRLPRATALRLGQGTDAFLDAKGAKPEEE